MYDTHPVRGDSLRLPMSMTERRTRVLLADDDKRRKSGSSGWLASILSSLPNAGSASTRWPHEKRDSNLRLSVPPTISFTVPPTQSIVPSLATVRFIFLCSLWYMSSALSSNTGKAILNQFKYPVTLTFVQFGFVAGYCLVFTSPVVRFTTMRKPTHAIILNTLPMAFFQVGGHIFSSMAISRVPVSTVHTIKALSPLFTVGAYALLFRVSYSPQTYLSLLPLTMGVMLACTFDMSGSNTLGLVCAFGSAIVFVTSNIFFKKVMPSPTAGNVSATTGHKLDKLNLLFYSSGLAFLLMIPIWIYCDLYALISSPTLPLPTMPPHKHGVIYYFFLNGTVHFAQNIIAFAILSSTSPVTYSIASLIKRIAVICIAIAWFNQSVHPLQAAGIGLTFFGLWMYNNAKADVERGENKMRRVEAARELMLPRTEADRFLDPPRSPRIPHEDINTPAYSISSSVERGHNYSSPTYQANHVPSPLSHTQSRPHTHAYAPPPLNLHVTTSIPKQTAAPNGARGVTSPVDSYPSPPPSNDSPPHTTYPFPPVNLQHRRGTVSGARPNIATDVAAGSPESDLTPKALQMPTMIEVDRVM